MEKFKTEMIQAVNGLKNIKGQFAEFGVHNGGTFKHLAPLAKSQNKSIHAFDSFKGLAEPSKFDMSPTGVTAYPKGKFNVNGSGGLVKEMNNLDYVQNKDYFIWEGFIPEIFNKVSKNLTFSFCYVDLDHYFPTKYTLEWIWNRMPIGSIVLCDDYNRGRVEGSASKGIYDFICLKKDYIDIINTTNWVNYYWHPTQIAWRKKNAI